jgi:hypothetical protein
LGATTDWTTLDLHTQIILGKVWRDGTDLCVANTRQYLPDLARISMQSHYELNGFARASGMVIGYTNRYVELTAGVAWEALSRHATSAFDTDPGGGADTFTYWSVNAGTWTDTAAQTQVDNLQYNDPATGLQALTVNRYGVHWVYLCHGNTLHVQYGQGNYILAQAQAAQVPTPPPFLADFAILVGKIIIQQNAAACYSAESPFEDIFVGAAPSDHGSLAGLGDQADHTWALTTDGSRVGATGSAQDFGANGILADNIDESSGGAGITFGNNTLHSSTSQAQFGDSDTYVAQDADGILALHADSYARVGSTASSRGLGADGDLMVSGKMEVEGFTFLDTNSRLYAYGLCFFYGSTVSFQGVGFQFAQLSEIRQETSSYNQLAFGLHSTHGRQFIFTEHAGRAQDHDHAVDTNPIVYFHDATQPNVSNNLWGSVHHDGTGFVLTSGANTGAGSAPATIDNYIMFMPRGSESFRIEGGGDILLAATKKLQLRDANLYIASDADGRLDLHADTSIDLNAATLITGNLTLGAAAAGVDYTFTWDGETSDATWTWDEDNAMHRFAAGAGTGGARHTWSRWLFDYSGDASLTIISPTTNSAIIGFGDTGDAFVGGMLYAHNGDTLTMYAANAALGIWKSGGLELANTRDLLCAAPGGSDLFSSGTPGGTSYLGRHVCAALTTNSQLQAGGAEIQGYSTQDMWVGQNLYFDGSNFKYRASASAAAARLSQDTTVNNWSYLRVQTANTGTAGNAVTLVDNAIIGGLPSGGESTFSGIWLHTAWHSQATGTYTILADGTNTYLNALTGGTGYGRINNATIFSWASGGLTLANTRDLLCAAPGGSDLFSSGTPGGSSYVGNSFVGDGNQGAPGFAFTSETTSGLYLAAAGTIDVTCAGTYSARFTGDYITNVSTAVGVWPGLRSYNLSAAAATTGTRVTLGGVGYANMATITTVWDAAANTDAALYFETRSGGAVAERWRITSAGCWQAAQNGSAAAPVISWISDPDLGLYRAAADTLDVTAGGTWMARFDSTPRFVLVGTAANNSTIRVQIQNSQAAAANVGAHLQFSGTAGWNTMAKVVAAWEGAATTESYLAFETRDAGALAEKWRITSDGYFRANQDGAVGTPVVSWISDPDTGIYRVGANDMGFAANGAQVAGVSAALFYLPAAVTAQFGTYAAITTETLQGFITINDAAGNPRKVGIVA